MWIFRESLMSKLSKTIDVQISDCDANGRLRPSVAQSKLLEVGEQQAGQFGVSYAELLRRDMCWVLYRQHSRFRRMPKAFQSIRATTWPGMIAGPVFPRFFVLEQDGERIGEAVTSWVLIQVSNRRPLRPSVLEGQLPQSPESEPLPLPGMLRIENARQVLERTVRYSDVDINGHMNNAKYLDWACDLLPFERLRERGICEWQINYTSETLPGETLALSLLEEGDAAYVQGKKTHDGRVAFEAKMMYVNG